MDGVRLVGFGEVQPLRDYGEQGHALPVRDILREPPADAGLAVMQAGIPSRPAARQTGPPGAAVLLLNFGYNHGNDCIKIMDAETGRNVHSRDVTWHQPWEPLISPAPKVGSEVPQLPSGTATPEYKHIQPVPAATTSSAAAPVPASNNAAPAPPPNPTASTRDRVVRELGHEDDLRMPGRTRGETRAIRESPHSMGLMSHAALAQGIATREAFNEAFREHELPPPDADFPTAPASDVPTPSTFAEAESSEYASIWRDSRTREFRGLFSWKSNEFGFVSKAKLRLVARGFNQREGIYFGETFAPTVSSFCAHLLIAIACELDLDVCHFDVEQAFVQSKLDEDVFFAYPEDVVACPVQ